MSQIPVQPLHPCLVALQTATGAVTFLVTRHPAAQIEHLGTQLEIAQSLVFTTPHAERIANELRLEFADKVVSNFGQQPYFLVDWEAVLSTLGEFDAASGRRTRMEDVAVGAVVQVEIARAAEPGRKERGEVTGISGRRYLVRLFTPVGDFTGMWATRAQIKPIVRTCALVGAA